MPFRLFVAVALLPAAALAADPLPPRAFARLGSTAWTHPDQPLALAAHPGGDTLASAGSDGTIRVWDVKTGKVRHTIARKGGTSALAYSADGKWLAAHFGNEFVRLYETNKYTETKELPARHGDPLALSADGKLLLASGPRGLVTLRDVATGQDRMELSQGRAAALLPSGGAVAVANEVNAVHVLEVPGGKSLAEYPPPSGGTGAVSHIAFHPAGKRIAVATAGKSPLVRVFDLGKPEPRFSAAGEGPLVFVGDTGLVGRSHGKLAVWDATTGKLLRTMGDGVTTLTVSADGRFAATDGGAFFPSPRIHLWDLKTGTTTNRAADDLADLRGITPRPTGGLAITAGGKLLTWHPGERKATTVKGLPAVRAVAPVGESLVAVSEAGKLFALAAPDRPFADAPTEARFLAADASGQVVAAAVSGAKPELLLANTRKAGTFDRWPLPARPLGVAVDPAGARVAVVGRDGYARVWATDADGQGQTPPVLWKERIARAFRGGIAFSPDGSRLAFTSLMRVAVHDAATGKQLARVDRTWDDGPFTSLAFSPDGRFVAAGTRGAGGAGVVWELVTGQRAGRFAGGVTVTGVAFLDGGRTLVTAGADGTLLAWDRTGRRGKPAPTARDFADAWLRLGDVNPETAYPATATLAAGGKAAAAFVLGKLKDEKDLNATVRAWVRQLSDKEYAVRERATKELIAVGGLALTMLAEAAKAPRSAEWSQRAKTVRGRIQTAADILPDPSLFGVPLRRLRAVAALEGITDPTATAALEALRDLGGPAGTDAARVLKGRK